MPVSFYEPVNVGSEFTIRTDANRNPIFWSIDIFNDGPDLYFGRSQLAGGGFLTIDYPGIVDSKSVTFGGTPGNLTMAPIPLPPAGLLLLAAVAGAASLRRRRPTA